MSVMAIILSMEVQKEATTCSRRCCPSSPQRRCCPYFPSVVQERRTMTSLGHRSYCCREWNSEQTGAMPSFLSIVTPGKDRPIRTSRSRPSFPSLSLSLSFSLQSLFNLSTLADQEKANLSKRRVRNGQRGVGAVIETKRGGRRAFVPRVRS